MRDYMVPESLLVAGRNVIAIRVTNNSGRGGIQPDSLGIALEGDGFQADLVGQWRYNIQERWQGRRPAVSASAPLAEQVLRAHNPVLDLVQRDTVGTTGVNYGDFLSGRGGRGGRGGGRGRAGGRGAGGRGDADAATGAAAAAGAAARGRAGVATAATAGAGELPLLELTLSAVPSQNKYDRTTIAARPGQPVRITFNNSDDMQHNIVIIQRNGMDAFTKVLDDMLKNPQDALGRGFIPDSRLIVESMPLVQARQNAVMEFIAPTQPGDYPFVCTFPGHWLTMKGVLRVQ
jgi:azurin